MRLLCQLFTVLFIVNSSIHISAQYNGALNFDGIDDYVSFSAAKNISGFSFTIEFWAKKDIGAAYKYVISKGNTLALNKYLHIGWDTATLLKFGFFSNDLVVTVPDDGQWHHWAFTYNASVSGQDNRFIYKDGVVIASDESPAPWTGGSNFEIGRAGLLGASPTWAGSLDRVAIYTYAKNATQIMETMFCETNAVSQIDMYDFNEESTSTLLRPIDDNPVYNGTLQNFALSGSTSNWVDNDAYDIPAFTMIMENRQISPGASFVLDPGFVPGDCGLLSHSFQWYKNGNPINGATSATLVFFGTGFSDAGVYQLQVTNQQGVLESNEVIISFVQFTATDNASDRYIDIDWVIPTIPCLYDVNNDPYDVVTIRLLRGGQEIFFQTYDIEDLMEFYDTPGTVNDDVPIIGTYRDFVGPDQNYNYDLMVFVGPFGNLDPDCMSFIDAGSTSMVQAPSDFMVSNDRLDEIEVSWMNNSDLATSFKLFREGTVIATITEGIEKNSTISFKDAYDFNDNNSIESGQDYTYTIEMNSSFTGQTWNYTVGDGSTLDINLMASKNGTSSVVLDWQSTASGLIDEYMLYRNNKLYAVKTVDDINHIDGSPLFGDSIDYQLRLIKEDTIIAAYDAKGYVLPNGMISGRVVTEVGQFPVKDVVVKAIRSSTNDTMTTMTNDIGTFSFTGLSYGLLDSFKLEANLTGHNFSYFPGQTISLSANNPNFRDVVILDDFTYTEGSNQHGLQVTVQGFYDQDFVRIQYGLSNSTPTVFLDFTRNGEVFYSTTISQPPGPIADFLDDLEGIPNEETKYEVRVYDIMGNTLSANIVDTTLVFPDVSRIPDGNFMASLETINSDLTGNVTLQWTHTSQNIDGFRIYRNDSLITELSKFILDYTDKEAPFDTDLNYTITAVRKIGNTTYETDILTAANPSILNLGPMPTPLTVSTSELGILPYRTIQWTLPFGVEPNFDFTGYCIYRNGSLMRKQDKSFPLSVDDFSGFGLTGIIYEVSLYRATKNGIIESDRVAASPADYPMITGVPTLTATASPPEGEVRLTWDTPNIYSNTDGFIIYYNGSFLVKLPTYTGEYRHFPSSGSSHNYQLYRYKEVNGQDILSTVSSSSNVNMSELSGVVYPPQNLTASRDLPNHVKLCWEYLDFIESEFEVWREGLLIATLPVGSRAYYDYAADPDDDVIRYNVRAKQAGQFSKIAGAIGDVVGVKLVYGTVTDPDTKVGIGNVTINRTIDGITQIVAETDSSGYYSFPLANEQVNTSVSIVANYYIGYGTTSNVLITDDNHYEVNFEIDIPEIFPYTDQAVIEYANVEVDVYDLSGLIAWKASNSNYDGVEVNRGLNVIADVLKSQGNVYEDTTAVPGITYDYLFRTYLNTNEGKVFSDYYATQVTYAPIEPVLNLTLTPLIEKNAVQVQWSHFYDHADGYAISRNGVFMAEVLKGNPFTYTDTTGVAGEQYTYTVVAYKLMDGDIYFSDEESVTITYPGAAEIKNLTLVAPFLENIDGGGNLIPIYYLNHIDITWEYEGFNNNGFKVFRDGELIATLPADSLHYKDYGGKPGVQTMYEVSAIVTQNEVSSESEKVSGEILFPEIERPYEVVATPRVNIGDVILNWKYQAPGVDYFKVEVRYINTVQQTVFIDGDKNLNEEKTYEFIDRNSIPTGASEYLYFITAFGENDGSLDSSQIMTSFIIDYPAPPVNNCSASQGTFDDAVMLTWEAPVEANIDSFTIVKNRMPGNVPFDEIVVEGGKRSYLDVFTEGEVVDSFTYEVLPGRVINGVYTLVNVGAPCSSLGWPRCATDNKISNFITGQVPLEIAINNNWKAVGFPFEGVGGVVRIYKFENDQWQETQQIATDSTSTLFGSSLDISDDILIIGEPFRNSGTPTGLLQGGVYTYRLNSNGSWQQESLIIGTPGIPGFGGDIAIDGNRFVVSSLTTHTHPDPFLFSIYQRVIRVFEIPDGCQAGTCYNEITVGAVNKPWMNTSMPYWSPNALGSAIDIDGDDIIVAAGSGWMVDGTTFINTDGFAHYTLDAGTVTVDSIYLDATLSEFGTNLSLSNGVLAVSAPDATSPSGVLFAGRVDLFRYQSNQWNKFQTIYSTTPIYDASFGSDVKLNSEFLAISEPNRPNDGSKFNVYKENPGSNLFDRIQSPDLGDNNYREEFFDSGSPDKYLSGFGYTFDISDQHIALAAANSSYILDLFPIEIENLIASDGTFNNTRVTWDLADCLGCPDDYIESYNIYRDNELVGNIDASTTQFIDEAGNLEPGASEATPGKEYIYEIEAVINAPFTYLSKKSADTGYSRRKGRLSGDVFVTGTSSGVSGVDIVVSGIDPTEQTTYTYRTTTLADGSFEINDMYVGTAITYTITPTYLDHDLVVASGNNFILTPTNPEENFIVIFDNTAFVISGQVKTAGTECGIDDILINYYRTINGVETLADTTTTDENGFYSLVVNPNEPNLNEIKIQIDNVQNMSTEQGDTSIVQYSFIPGEQMYTGFNNFPVETRLDFADHLTYPVTVSVENTCGNALADNPIIIRVSSTDGCVEYNDTTDNFGVVDLHLSPKEYLLSVEGIVGSGVDNYENAGVDYLSLRPVSLNLLDLHIEAGDANPLPQVPTVKFVYHRAVNFAFTTSFDRYLCDNTQNAAILTQGDTYNMDFILSENHRAGENCEVNSGYIVVRNSGAEKVLDTIQLVNGSFETYNFIAGLPNLVAPHTWAVSLQYFSEQGSLLGSRIIPIIVEGQRLLPGTGIITDALTDEAGDLQMPLLVLRDPPGDNSYSTIESGSTISKSLDFTSEASGSLGFFLESSFAVLGAGAFANVQVGVGGGNTNGATFNFDITTTQSYSTSSDEGAVGRSANVIVGSGISTQYGITQVLKYDDDCTPNNFKILGFGLGGFNSTYAYTVSFIEGLIDGYRRDSMLVEMDLLPVTRPDGSLYTKDEARARFTSLIDTWEEMLHYHDVETVPHYVLCQDFSYRDDLDANAQALYDGWRNGFCNQIGSYQGDQFMMDEEIIWTPDLINAYNNAIAFTDEIKGLPRDFVDNGDLDVTNYDIAANDLSFTNQFHNLLGNNAKTAEVFDISGNVNFSKTITAQQSSSTSKSFSRYFYLDIAAGAAVSNGTLIGLGLFSVITDIEAKIGARITANAKISVNKTQAESNQSTISYNIYDNDPEDQVTFLALQAPLQDQTPYFIRLGGLSSCPPEEALTLNQDNSPLLIDDPTITVIIDPVTGAASPNPPPVYDVDPEDAAVFEVQLGNIGPTGLTRDARVFLDRESNPFGAVVKIGGSNLNAVSPVFSIPAGGSITQFLTIERPGGTPFYVFEGLRIGVEPACGGEAKYINLDVYFQSPCSQVSLTKPFDGFVVDRINPFVQNDLEIIPFELRDFQPDNELLEYIQLQYKRLGTGSDWQNVPGGRIDRQTLVNEVAGLPVGQDPLYFYEWDITGRYSLYPDGNYAVRAFAFCGTNGRQYSNETEITLARSALLITGFPEPADGRWTNGDEISVTYTTDIDCGIYNVLDNQDIMEYITLVDLETMMMVPFTFSCQNNKLTLIPTGDISNYDGHTLRATYKNITNIIGNKAQDVFWDFEVITQQVDWDEEVIEVTIAENEMKTITTSLFNTTGTTVNGLSLSGSQPWYTFTPSGTFSVPSGGQLVDLTFDGSIGKGVYTTMLQVNGLPGRTPTLMIQLNVVENVPIGDIGMYSDSMELVLNWSFTNPILPSVDVNDVIQVYKNGSLRGFGNIEEQGNYYFSRIKVYGNISDENEKLDFVIWNADESQAYTPIASTNINFKRNTVRGVLTNPDLLLVEGDLFEFRKRIYVDSTNVTGIQDGTTWATAFSDLQDALAVAYDLDTIWMAEGSYYPAVADRTTSYVGNNSIVILGGFQNGMTDPGQRTGNNETILSGNIGIKATDTDNTYQVFRNSGGNIILDMLTIRDGNADGLGENNTGSCLYNSGTITLINVKMENGNATGNGRLIFNEGDILIDGGVFFVPANDGISNILNTNGATLTIKNNVSILKQQ